MCPNKKQGSHSEFYKGHLLESETYVGGHVECLESGVFRSDIPCRFRLNAARMQSLIDSLDRLACSASRNCSLCALVGSTLEFALGHEHKLSREDVVNYDSVKAEIEQKLAALRDKPDVEANPLIYHLDVAVRVASTYRLPT